MANRRNTSSDGDAAMPTKEDILDFLSSADGKITKRDIARAFGLRGADKIPLKRLLREMTEDGLIAQDHARSLRKADTLPNVIVAEFAGTDRQGEVLLKPVERRFQDLGPVVIRLGKDRTGARRRGGGQRFSALGPGDRALVRLSQITDGHTKTYSARVIKRLEVGDQSILGVFHGGPGGGRLKPVDKKIRDEFWVAADDIGGAEDGELVEAAPSDAGRRRLGPKHVRIVRRLGDLNAPRSISLIAIHAHGIPVAFPEAATRQAERAKPPTLEGRVDLRTLPLITIDPSDARDHDDAVFAEPDPDPKNAGGWHAVVAIADVSHFVTPGSALDKAARERGNSCYFPDRVVPMLPEALSAGLCSLKPGEDRAALVAHLWFSSDGVMLRHRFERAMIHSHANLAYEQVQAALDGHPDHQTAPLLDTVLKPLHALFQAIMAARAKREPLDLDLPERKIELNEQGEVIRIAVRERMDAHRIIEELMISANVAAAEALERAKMPVMYRVHEEPPKDKLEALNDFLKPFDLAIARGTVMKPRLFNGILAKVQDTPHAEQVNEMILRSQTQAYYGQGNQGHFGLALARYAHFTSPIRRYADLLVHRALVRGLGLGDGGLTDAEIAHFDDTAQHISNTERRAMAAERDATDRYVAAYLSDKVGEDFKGRITGVTRFGLFVELLPSGGQGLLPISSLGSEYFHFDAASQTIKGDRSGTTYHLGDRIEVSLLEADRYTGSVRLALVGGAGKVPKGARHKQRPPKGRKRRR